MRSDLESSTLVADRLRELPAELAPPLSWDELRSRMNSRAQHSRRAVAGQTWSHAALAASVTALVVGLAIWSRIGPQAREFLQISESGMVKDTQIQAQFPTPALPDVRVIKQAEASERWLAHLPAEPAVMRVGTRGAVADLEDRIAFVDDVLSEEALDAINPTHLVALRHERARLVNSLAQVRYAETLAAGAR